MIFKVEKPDTAAGLFDGWEETIIWSCVQGIMGEIYGDKTENPGSAMAVLGDFVFFAGKPDRELVLFRPKGCLREFVIMVGRDQEWEELIEQSYGEQARKVSRYAFKKEPGAFDEEKLTRATLRVPEGYELRMMDEAIYHKCREGEWSRDLVSQFRDYETYEKLGLGAVILKDGELAAGASSYTRYRDGIEVEIDTKEEYRRRGLAYACGAKLILECEKRNLYPSWDAQNLWSAALAKKLGYRYSHVYTAYEIREY